MSIFWCKTCRGTHAQFSDLLACYTAKKVAKP